MQMSDIKPWLKKFSLTFLGFLAMILLIPGFSILYALHHTPNISIDFTQSDRIVIENAQILDIESSTLLQKQHIIIESGNIKSIVHRVPPKKNNELRIDINNKVIMPGLIDMHVHLFDRSDLLLNLAHGITTIRSMHGLPQQLAFKDELVNKQYPGPRIILSSPIINQSSQYRHSDFHYFVETPEQARKLVNQFAKQGYEIIKIYDGIKPEIFKAIRDESKRLDLPFAGHPSFFIPIETYLNSGAQSLEHTEMLYQAPLNYSNDDAPLSHLINQIKASGMYITATLVNYEDLAQVIAQKQIFVDQQPLQYMNPYLRKLNDADMAWALNEHNIQPWLEKSEHLQRITQALYRASIPMLIGSDAGAGYTLHGIGTIREMQLLEKNGIDTNTILHSATINAADALGLGETIGRIEAGKKADLIICSENPISNLSTLYQLAGVIKEDTYFDQQSILSLKQQAEQHMAFSEVLGWYFIDLIKRM